MTVKKRFRRRNYFVDKKAQGKYVLWVIFYIVLYTIILSTIIYLPANLSLTDERGLYAYSLIEEYLDYRVLPMIFIFLIVVGIHVILTTHRFFGPIIRFKSVAADIAKGDLTERVRLRKSDHLLDYSESFNEMVAALDERVGKIKKKEGIISERFTRLMNDIKNNNLSQTDICKDIEGIQKTLRELESAVNYFK